MLSRGFPPPADLNGYKYFDEARIERFEAANMGAAQVELPQPDPATEILPPRRRRRYTFVSKAIEGEAV